MAVELAMLNDVEKCIACRGCSVACKQWHNLPAEPTPFDGEYQSRKDLTSNTYTLIRMQEAVDENTGKVRWDFLKYQCMHCGQPYCINSCPYNAITKNEYGFVLVNEDMCTGCTLCESVCLYSVPHVHNIDKKSRKCNMCIDRIEKYVASGYSKKYMPSCAKTCTTEAILFGPKEEMLRIANERLEVLKTKYPDACLYNADSTSPRGVGGMIYILPYKPSVYGLPDETVDSGSGASPALAAYKIYQSSNSK